MPDSAEMAALLKEITSKAGGEFPEFMIIPARDWHIMLMHKRFFAPLRDREFRVVRKFRRRDARPHRRDVSHPR